MMLEVHGKMDSYTGSGSFTDFVKPFSEKHSAGVGKKLQDFNAKHPEANVGPQSLIALSTEQTQKLQTEVASGAGWLCQLARAPITMATTLYCTMVFGWSMNMFDVFACQVSFQIPFEAVCSR